MAENTSAPRFRASLAVSSALFALLAAAAPVAAQLRLPLSESVRDAAMGGVTRLNVILGLAYIAGTLFGGAG